MTEIEVMWIDRTDDGLKESARLYKALSDETRLRILKRLAAVEPGAGLCVGALASSLGVTQSAVSQHLAVLRGLNLVIDERRGYFVHYRLNPAAFDRWRDQIRDALGEELARALFG